MINEMELKKEGWIEGNSSGEISSLRRPSSAVPLW